MRYFAPLIALILLSAAAVSEPASAQPNRAREGVQSGEVRPLNEILPGIRRERPGSLADVEGPINGPSGEPHYRLKWLTPDGRVLWLDTDARTGRVLGVQGDDRPRPGAVPPGQQDPRRAQGSRRNLNPPPADQYDFSAPGIRPPRSGPGVRRPLPDQNFAPGRQQPDYYGPPPEFRRNARPPQQFRGRPPPQGFDRGPGFVPQGYGRGPGPEGYDRPPVAPRGGDPQGFDRGPSRPGFEGPSAPPRGGFDRRVPFGGGAMDRSARPRGPEGEPRGPRRFR